MKLRSAVLLTLIGCALMLLCQLIQIWKFLDRLVNQVFSSVVYCHISYLVFAVTLFFFFLIAHDRYVIERLKIASLLGMISSVWIFLNGLLKVIPASEEQFTSLVSPTFMSISDILKDLLLMIFFILYLRKQLGKAMSLVTKVAITGIFLILLTSISKLLVSYFDVSIFSHILQFSPTLHFIRILFLLVFFWCFRIAKNKH